MKLKPLIERHSLAAYFCLAFGISWSGALLIIWLQGVRTESATWEQGVVWYLAMLAGPTLACLLLTAVLEGREGLRDLYYRLIHWRVSPHWYAISLLTNPLIVLATLTILAILVDPVYRPIFEPIMFIFGLGAGLFEEIGWTGFATPRILRRPAWFTAAIGFGLLHGLWHLPVDFFGASYAMGPYWLPNYLVFWVGGLTAYRVFMVWVYQHTRSLLLGILLHTVFTGSFLVFWPEYSPAEQMTWGAVYTASLWLLVAGLTLSERKIRSQNYLNPTSKNTHPEEVKLKSQKASQLFYEIRVEGELGDMWSGWFEGLSISKEFDEQNGCPITILFGFVPDQPALHAVLNKIRDLNLTLISIRKKNQMERV